MRFPRGYHLTGFVVSLLVAVAATAEPKYILNTTQSTTSDDLKMSEFWFGYISEPIDPFWPYQSEASVRRNWSLLGRQLSVDRPGYSYSGAELLLGGTQRFGESWTLHAAFGAHLLNAETVQKESSHGIGEMEGTYSDQKSIWVSLRAAEQFHYPQILPLAGDPSKVKGTALETHLLYQPISQLRMQLKHQSSWLHDDNHRRWSDVQGLWGFQTSPHWIWLGIGAEHQENSQSTPNYWSPDRFTAWGPRAETSFRVLQNWELYLGGSLNRFKESSFDAGNGHYVNTGIRYGSRERSLFHIGYESVRSTQGGKTWKSDSLGFSFNLSW